MTKLLLVLAVAVLAGCASAPPYEIKPGAPAPNLVKADRPIYAVGDSWTYSYRNTRYNGSSAYTEKIESIDKDKILFSWVNSDRGAHGTFLRNRDLQGLGEGLPSSGWPNFHFPLRVGETWHMKYQSHGPGTRDYDNTLTTTVVSTEKVTVPAGTFSTFKIVAIRNYIGTNNGFPVSGEVKDIFWVSPKVKNFVRRVYTDYGVSSSPIVRELLKYNVQ